MTTSAALIDSMMTDCVMITKERIPDGLGGFIGTEWVDGAPFRAAISKNDTLAAQVAEKQGVTAIYTVTTAKGVGLEFHEVFRRVKDGKIFRVTTKSTDSMPPDVATFSFEQVKAEEWTLPDAKEAGA